MKLKAFQDLGHVYRNEPCQEYPGKWIVYVNGNDPSAYGDRGEAYVNAAHRSEDTDAKVSVCWECSDNDPRIGQVWFTPFYQAYCFKWGRAQ